MLYVYVVYTLTMLYVYVVYPLGILSFVIVKPKQVIVSIDCINMHFMSTVLESYLAMTDIITAARAFKFTCYHNDCSQRDKGFKNEASLASCSCIHQASASART